MYRMDEQLRRDLLKTLIGDAMPVSETYSYMREVERHEGLRAMAMDLESIDKTQGRLKVYRDKRDNKNFSATTLSIAALLGSSNSQPLTVIAIKISHLGARIQPVEISDTEMAQVIGFFEDARSQILTDREELEAASKS